TAEIVLGIIGAVFYLFSIVIGALRVWAENNKEFLENYVYEHQDEMQFTSVELESIEQLMSVNLAPGGILLVILPLFAIILGVIAMILLKGNKQPIAAGIIFVAVGVLYPIITLGGGILSGILYLIAGILC